MCDEHFSDRRLYPIEVFNEMRRNQKKMLEELDEFTIKKLKQGADNDIIRRAREQSLSSYYQGIDRDGVMEFETTAITTDGQSRWEQEIKLLDLEDAIDVGKDDMELSDRDIADLAIYGDVAVHCNCPSFKWHGYQYIAWQLDYGLKPQNNKPDTRNPDRKGTVCKHLYNVFVVLPSHIDAVFDDLRRMGKI